MVQCGVAWCGVWCGVVWCGVVAYLLGREGVQAAEHIVEGLIDAYKKQYT